MYKGRGLPSSDEAGCMLGYVCRYVDVLNAFEGESGLDLDTKKPPFCPLVWCSGASIDALLPGIELLYVMVGR